MRKVILTLVLVLWAGLAAFAQQSETLSLRNGQQKTTAHSRITVKFISVLDDSRCPANAKCIWAGNVRIKVSISKRRKAPKTFELNSTLSPQLAYFEGYAIKLVDLVPRPGEKVKRAADRRTVTLSVTKLVFMS